MSCDFEMSYKINFLLNKQKEVLYEEKCKTHQHSCLYHDSLRDANEQLILTKKFL